MITEPPRNKPCPCGSGLKYKKCCYMKKPRTQMMMFHHDKPIDMTNGVVQISISPSGIPTFHLSKDGTTRELVSTSVTLATFYDRFSEGRWSPDIFNPETKRKVTNLFSTTNIDALRSGIELMENFDVVISVDTSYRPEDPQGRCCSGVLLLSKVGDQKMVLNDALIIEFDHSKYPPELAGWIIAIRMFKDAIPVDRRVGVLVDSDLRRLEAINKRSEQIVDGFELPNNFELVYASSDTKNDQVCNRTIWLSDRLSKYGIQEGSPIASIGDDFFRDGRVGRVPVTELEALMKSAFNNR